MITVDGDTSTNDMVLVMANHQVEHQILSQDHPQWETFVDAFNFVCTFLAKAIAREGKAQQISSAVSMCQALNQYQMQEKSVKLS